MLVRISALNSYMVFGCGDYFNAVDIVSAKMEGNNLLTPKTNVTRPMSSKDQAHGKERELTFSYPCQHQTSVNAVQVGGLRSKATVVK